MSKFSDKLVVEPVGDGKNWIVYNSFSYQSDILDTTISIPQGFITDGASIPRFFWNIFIPTGPYFQAAVIHDYLYRHQVFTRYQSDNSLLEGMWILHCKLRQYSIIYIMVRLFGWHAWWRDGKLPMGILQRSEDKNIIKGNNPKPYHFWNHT